MKRLLVASLMAYLIGNSLSPVFAPASPYQKVGPHSYGAAKLKNP
jgi:hypothetical protein